MKIKTDIHAGMTFEECDQIRNYWKNQAQLMGQYSKTCFSPAGLYFPPDVYNNQPQAKPPAPPQPPSPTPPQPGPQGSGCGWVDGVYFPDQSGLCG